MRQMTLGSLFDGLGGWQIAAIRANIKPVWSSEIEKFPVTLTKYRFPNTQQLGDITKIKGNEIEPVDIITSGSPCQDLSLAGNRSGLDGKRSGLFFEAMRIVREMKEKTHGVYPRYFVWENVPGAYSSNKGMDFKAVLEEITETSIPVPRHNKWAKSGMVRSGVCTVIWRTLDAQYWGVPQRRRRIFLVADYTGGGGTEEILFKPEVLSRDTQQSGTERKGVRPIPDGHPGKPVTMCLDMTHACDVIRVNKGVSPTLQHRMGTGGNQIPLTIDKPTFCVGNGQLAQLHMQKNVGSLNCMHDQQIIAIYQRDGKVGALNAADRHGINNQYVQQGKIMVTDYKLRRLTPLECERLQGLPDNWTLIDDKTCSDSARYKAIGNGMAQPCADFVIKRIAEHEESKT